MAVDFRNPGIQGIRREILDLRFVDVEASGLHKGSYPIEIAWCAIDLKPVSILVKPLPGWGPDNWSVQAEKIHGISFKKLCSEGSDGRECANAMAVALDGREVFSDNPHWDAAWLSRLFSETGTKPTFGLRDLVSYMSELSFENGLSEAEADELANAVRVFFPHTHRAGEDALGMAALVRGIIDPRWRGAVVTAAEKVRRPA